MKGFNLRLPISVLLLSFFLGGCLQTRNSYKEAEEKQVMQKQVSTLQRTTADVNARFQDLEDDDRKLSGRIEALEHRTNQLSQKAEQNDQGANQNVKQLSEKLVVYQEALTKLDQDVADLKAQVAQLSAAAAARAASANTPAAKQGDSYAEAEELFKNGKFRDAILEYEKYRKASPKGKQVGESTYKIGVCFQELGMSDEAKAFYEEVIARFPKTKEAERANYRLKNLKKK